MNRLSGAWFKLVSDKGVYLGLLSVPENVAYAFEKKHELRVMCYRQPRHPFVWDAMALQGAIRLEQFIVAANWRFEYPDALVLFMITPEEISAEPGFAFMPSAEYLRRPVAEKLVEREIVAPGKHLAAAREVVG